MEYISPHLHRNLSLPNDLAYQVLPLTQNEMSHITKEYWQGGRQDC